MNCFKELSMVLNKAGVELTELKSDDMDLVKKLFLWSELMDSCSNSKEAVISPYKNYLSALYIEKMRDEK